MSSSTIPYIGSKISLVSNAEIRYEGVLYTINTQESTIALQSVRSFGTEGRKLPEIPPSSEIYDFIIFRGQDIKDLTVLESSQKSVMSDPAVMSVNQKPAGSGPPPAQKGGGYDGGKSQGKSSGGGWWEQNRQDFQKSYGGDSAWGKGSGSYGQQSSWGYSDKGGKDSGKGSWGKSSGKDGGKGYSSGKSYDSGKGKSDGKGKSSDKGKSGGKSDGKGKGYDGKGKSTYVEKGKGGGGKGKGKAGQEGTPVGELLPDTTGAGKKEFTEDFDVSGANAGFSKVASIDDATDEMKPLAGYDKSSSFFDNISCEATERAGDVKREKVDRAKAQENDRVTFGDTRRPPRPVWSRRGKGKGGNKY